MNARWHAFESSRIYRLVFSVRFGWLFIPPIRYPESELEFFLPLYNSFFANDEGSAPHPSTRKARVPGAPAPVHFSVEYAQSEHGP
jgi:hypothetical protein